VNGTTRARARARAEVESAVEELKKLPIQEEDNSG